MMVAPEIGPKSFGASKKEASGDTLAFRQDIFLLVRIFLVVCRPTKIPSYQTEDHQPDKHFKVTNRQVLFGRSEDVKRLP